jgi:hemerythrin
MMERLTWKAEYSIGIRGIDAQHRKIFECLLALEAALQKKEAWHSMRYLIAQLTENLELHWATEEALLEIIHYPHLEKHRLSHAKLNNEIRELENRLRDHHSTDDLVKFFETWFIEHVLAGDADYVDHARRKFPADFSR